MQAISWNRTEHFTLQALGDGIFAAIAEDGGAAICNTGLMDLGDQVIVFDTFMTPQAARDLKQFSIEQFGRAPHIAIDGHYHNDHTWGNQAFLPEAQILTSALRNNLIIVTRNTNDFLPGGAQVINPWL